MPRKSIYPPPNPGDIFNLWTVIRTGLVHSGAPAVSARCQCGEGRTVVWGNIRRGLSKGCSSCAGFRGGRRGKKGRNPPLAVGDAVGLRSVLEVGLRINRKLAVRVRCSCGSESVVLESSLRRRDGDSGCIECRDERLREAPEDTAKRFWARVDGAGGGGCEVWTGCTTPNGYGQFCIHGEQILAHRASWEMLNGSVPEGKLVLHSCDNRPCVNPKHLFIGTAKDNSQDMMRKGRGRGQFPPRPRP